MCEEISIQEEEKGREGVKETNVHPFTAMIGFHSFIPSEQLTDDYEYLHLQGGQEEEAEDLYYQPTNRSSSRQER